MEIVYKGKIDGEFEGFNDQVLFKMKNGTYWIQAQYRYWYHYAYNPDATLTRDGGKFVLTVSNKSIPVRKVTSVIESQIKGKFEGWNGKSIYELQNGQVWQQTMYKYEYKYAYMPEAIVYEAIDGYRMSVAGTSAGVHRLK